ncbi:unnamed protein product [Calypogeia fissa]
MATAMRNTLLVLGVLILAFSAWEEAVQASDPEPITDFEVPPWVNISTLDGNYFTYIGFRGGVSVKPGQVNHKEATLNDFPALYGLGISFYLMYFQPGGVLPPHIHPRGSKLIYIIQGTLSVGFIDSTYKNYNQTLIEGDVYVVPKAMVHYMANLDSDVEVKVIFSFSSSNPGTILMPNALFGSVPNIPDAVLESSFKVSGDVISDLKAPFSN